jgi:hypothetical protein
MRDYIKLTKVSSSLTTNFVVILFQIQVIYNETFLMQIYTDKETPDDQALLETFLCDCDGPWGNNILWTLFSEQAKQKPLSITSRSMPISLASSPCRKWTPEAIFNLNISVIKQYKSWARSKSGRLLKMVSSTVLELPFRCSAAGLLTIDWFHISTGHNGDTNIKYKRGADWD